MPGPLRPDVRLPAQRLRQIQVKHQCDMVFDLDLTKALGGEADIRTQWAWQRAYFLIGEHNRMKQPGVLTELKTLGKTYGIKIPYRNEWGQ